MIGKTVSHYRIIEKLGEGGMGVVYLAEDTSLGRRVALKFLSGVPMAGEGTEPRFNREAKAAASLNHPAICTIHEIDTHEGSPFIVMEYVDGESLASVISRGPMKLGRAVALAAQIAEGLDHAHEHGIVHRDIKPDNIMLDASGRLKIMDFGLASVTGRTRITREGTTVGTISYMSPEQARGEEVDHRSDIWSLGAVLYELVTGRRPFKGDYDQVITYGIINEDPEPPTSLRSGVPMELERIILKALEKLRDERYQHADEMLSDLRKLQRLMEKESISEKTPAPYRTGSVNPRVDVPEVDSPFSAAGKHRGGNRRIWLIASVSVIAVAVFAYVVLKPVILERRLIASPRPIAVISFENMTGDPAYDYLRKAIPNLLITSLEQSEYLRVTTWERMRDLLNQMGRGEDVDVIGKEVGFELCLMDGIEIIVTGSFVKAGNTFVTDVKVLDVRTKELLKSASAKGSGVESILDKQVDELSREIADGAGLSEIREDKSQRPVAEVSTESMEAYNYYLRGVEEYDRYYYEDARRFLEKAVKIDSTFAMAHMLLGSTYGYLKDFVSRDRQYEIARNLSERATEREKLYIKSRYALVIEDDVQKHKSILEELVRKFPKEKTAYYWLGVQYNIEGNTAAASDYMQKVLSLDPGNPLALNLLAYIYLDMGEYQRALDYMQRYASASPGDANPLDSMGELYFRMGDLERSVEKYREAVEVKPGFYSSIMSVAYVYGVMGKFDSSIVWVDRFIDEVPNKQLSLYGYAWRSLFFFVTGRVKEAFEDIERWKTIVEEESSYLTSTQKYFEGNYLMLIGRFGEAIEAFSEWGEFLGRNYPEGKTRKNIWVACSKAAVYAREGRVEQSKAQYALVEKLWPEYRSDPTSSFFVHLDIIAKGEVLLAEGSYREAITTIQEELRFLLPKQGSEMQLTMHNFPLEMDIAARAYLALGEKEKAAREYLRIIEFDPSSNNRRFRYPLYHYRLAKVYEDMGRTEAAVEHYGIFLRHWRKADPDLPQYIDARKRLAELSGS